MRSLVQEPAHQRVTIEESRCPDSGLARYRAYIGAFDGGRIELYEGTDQVGLARLLRRLTGVGFAVERVDASC